MAVSQSESSVADDRIGKLVAGKYRVVRLLGEGGMGAVYEAVHQVTRRRVAIKLIRPGHEWSAISVERFERFVREARVSATVGHRNIIEVLDAGTSEDGTPYMVLTLLHGESLGARLKRLGTLPMREALEIVCEVLEGLEAAHSVGVIHRDIKPENVFVSPGANGKSEIKVLDFGISKVVSDETDPDPNPTLTKTGSILGTPDYMSPEQMRGEEGLDGRTDVWSVGVMLYELLSGRVPFVGRNFSMIVLSIMTEEPVPLSRIVDGIPQVVSDIVGRAMTKSRDARYASAAILRDELRKVLDAAPESLHCASVTESSAPPRRSVPPDEDSSRSESEAMSLGATQLAIPAATPLPAPASDKLSVQERSDAEGVAAPRRQTSQRLVIGIAGLVAVLAGIGWIALRSSGAPVSRPALPAASSVVTPPVSSRQAPPVAPEAIARPIPLQRVEATQAAISAPTPAISAEATANTGRTGARLEVSAPAGLRNGHAARTPGHGGARSTTSQSAPAEPNAAHPPAAAPAPVRPASRPITGFDDM